MRKLIFLAKDFVYHFELRLHPAKLFKKKIIFFLAENFTFQFLMHLPIFGYLEHDDSLCSNIFSIMFSLFAQRWL